MNFTLEVESEKLNAALTKLAGTFSNVRPALRPAAERIVRAAREQIDTAGKRSGKPWAARAESTLKSITSANRKGFTSIGLPGRSSDRMFASVGTMGGPDSVYQETEDGVTVGTKVRSKRGFPYAVAFQRGTGRQPARPIYDPTERDIKEIAAVMKKSFRERIEPLGFDYRENATDIVF